jgi:hypothetical protein
VNDKLANVLVVPLLTLCASALHAPTPTVTPERHAHRLDGPVVSLVIRLIHVRLRLPRLLLQRRSPGVQHMASFQRQYEVAQLRVYDRNLSLPNMRGLQRQVAELRGRGGG